MTIALAFEKKEIVEWTVWKHVSTRIVVEKSSLTMISTKWCSRTKGNSSKRNAHP